MRIYKEKNDNVLFSGDLHGDFAGINVTINTLNLQNCSLIICGDIGIGFEKEEYYNQQFTKINKILEKRNISLYMFRGNHDSKSFFDGEHFTDFTNIKVIPDYSIIQTPTRNILCIGGAYSIDRTWCKQREDIMAVQYMRYHNCDLDKALQNCKRLYWEDEPFIYDEEELSQLNELDIKIDTVCTHTSPSMCQPLTKIGIKSWLDMDDKLEDDLNQERSLCDKVLDYLKLNNHPITNWYYAHFHFHNTEIIDGVNYTLLDMMRKKLDVA